MPELHEDSTRRWMPVAVVVAAVIGAVLGEQIAGGGLVEPAFGGLFIGLVASAAQRRRRLPRVE